MDPSLIERYFDGFRFTYIPLQYWLEPGNGKEGYWERDPNDPLHIIVYYNATVPEYRQRFTKTHELFHFVQSVDSNFLNFFDELILNTTLPAGVVQKILERGTDKAVAMYLMPNRYFMKKYAEIIKIAPQQKDAIISELARYFAVSRQSASIRLQECGLLLPA